MTHKIRVTADQSRQGFVHLDGWAGRTKQPVEVIGETPKRYRVKAIGKVHLAGRCRVLLDGETALVPKYAISFT